MNVMQGKAGSWSRCSGAVGRACRAHGVCGGVHQGARFKSVGARERTVRIGRAGRVGRPRERTDWVRGSRGLPRTGHTWGRDRKGVGARAGAPLAWRAHRSRQRVHRASDRAPRAGCLGQGGVRTWGRGGGAPRHDGGRTGGGGAMVLALGGRRGGGCALARCRRWGHRGAASVGGGAGGDGGHTNPN